MPAKPSKKSTTPKPGRKATASTGKAAAKPPKLKPTLKHGEAGARAAFLATGLNDTQKHNIVRSCIIHCSGVRGFAEDDPLSTIAQGIEGCVQACVSKAVHRSVSVVASDTEDDIVANI